MKTLFLEADELYDGRQLVSLRNYLKHKILGDSMVAWVGPCNVSLDHMVDGEDLLAGAEIRGGRMVHFIAELFDSTLFAGVGIQRLLASLVLETLRDLSPVRSTAESLTRDGDDILFKQQKLSISIATQSPVSTLIHFAVNVTNDGTPVPTLSLHDLQVDPVEFAKVILKKFEVEVTSIREATQKVRWVK